MRIRLYTAALLCAAHLGCGDIDAPTLGAQSSALTLAATRVETTREPTRATGDATGDATHDATGDATRDATSETRDPVVGGPGDLTDGTGGTPDPDPVVGGPGDYDGAGDPGGLPPPPPGYEAPDLHPAMRRPVVYRRYITGASDGGYASNWSRADALGYHPTVLNTHDDAAIGARYTGVWHKDVRVTGYASRRNMTEPEYLAEAAARAQQGYRVIDIDGHDAGGSPRYHAIWIAESVPTSGRSHHQLTRDELEDAIADYRLEGYRPIRISAYRGARGAFRFAAVWVRDGRTDFIHHIDMDDADYDNIWAVYRNHGYAPVDTAPYVIDGTVRYAGIWLAEDSTVDGWASVRDRTADEIEELDEDYAKRNLVMVDLDGYGIGAGQQRFTAIWRRPLPRRVISSNRPTAADPDIAALRAVVDEYEQDGFDARRGSIGAFVVDLETGAYVAYNMHEPFYMASTSKVLIGARATAHPNIDMTDTQTLTSTMWRGEDTRGFVKADIGDDFALSTYMMNMIRRSDTLSTDYFAGRIAALDGTYGLQDWLRDAVGLQNVGEITSICDVDRRIQAGADACVFDVSCDTLEAFFRGGELYNATAAEQTCLEGLSNPNSLENHDTYYATLANTITPAEMGLFWQKLADGELMTDADRAELLVALDAGGNDGFAIGESVQYDDMGTKNGGKRRVSSQVGMMWDYLGAWEDDGDIAPRYAYALFTEDWSWEAGGDDLDQDGTSDDTQWARDAMRGVLGASLSFLQSQ